MALKMQEESPFISQEHFKYKVTYLSQRDSKSAIVFFLLICILMGKGGIN